MWHDLSLNVGVLQMHNTQCSAIPTCPPQCSPNIVLTVILTLNDTYCYVLTINSPFLFLLQLYKKANKGPKTVHQHVRQDPRTTRNVVTE